MNRFIVAILVVACCSCGGPTTPTQLSISPSSASLRVGDSQSFTFVGGEEPFIVLVEGSFQSDGDRYPRLYDMAAYSVVRLERSSARVLRVTFMDAKLKPASAVLTVIDMLGNTARAPLELSY